MKFVGRSLLAFLAIFIPYSLLIGAAGSGGIPGGENQWSENIFRGERYIYDERDAPVVIVGSSLAWRLRDSTLPEGFSNLSMAGRSALLGLEILRRSGTRPELVLIEANHIDRPLTEGELDRIFGLPLAPARRAFPALREEGRPSLRLLTWLRGHVLSASLRDVTAGAAGGRREESALFRKVLARHVRNHGQAPRLDEALEGVSAAIRHFGRQGTAFAFFEMPSHPRLCESPHFLGMREELKAFSARESVHYIEAGDCSAYGTTDAHHLDGPGVLRFLGHLAAEIDDRGLRDGRRRN